MQPDAGPSFVALVAAYGTPLLAYVVLRALTVRLIHGRMMRRAPAPFVPPSLAPPPLAPSVAPSADAEVPNDVRFVEVDAGQSVQLEGAARARFDRALRSGRRGLGVLLLAVGVFAAAMAAVLGASGVSANALGFTGYAFLAATLIAAVVVLDRYVILRRVSAAAAVGVALYLIAASAVLALIHSRNDGVSVALILAPALLAIGGIAWWFASAVRRKRAAGNRTLLVLRVFGADRNTASVFGPLMRRWQYLGGYFTIADPSFVRYQTNVSTGASRWRLLRTVTLVGIVAWGIARLPSTDGAEGAVGLPWYYAWMSIPAGERQQAVEILLWLLLIPLAVLPILVGVRRRFVSNEAALVRRVAEGAGAQSRWSQVYRGTPLYCYDDVWKRAVRAMLDVSDVVLMDLRGFSPQRRGCEYEIGELVDHYPAGRVVLLVDPASKAHVLDVVRARWAAMAADSPNRPLGDPALHVYTVTEHDDRDPPRILALLAAAGDGAGDAPRLSPGRTRGPIRRALAAWGRFVRRVVYAVSEGLDVAIASPRYARVVVPALLLFVSGALAWRVAPVARRAARAANPVTLAVTDVPGESADGAPVGDVAVRADLTAACDQGQGEGIASLNFSGGAAATVAAVGAVIVTSVVDAEGRATPVDGTDIAFGGAFSGWTAVRRTDAPGFGDDRHPADGFCATVHLPESMRDGRAAALSGTVAVRAGDRVRTVRLDSVGARMTDSMVVLSGVDRVGLAWVRLERSDSTTLVVTARAAEALRDVDVDVVAPDGTSLGGSSSTDETSTQRTYQADRATLDGARLEIRRFARLSLPFTVRLAPDR